MNVRSLVALAATATMTAFLVVAAPSGVAVADPGFALSFFSGGHGANAHWSTQSPPLGVLQDIVLSNPLPTGDTYTGAWVHGVSGMTMSQVSELSFMIDTDHYMGAGAPRFSVILSDGVYLYPSAGDCFNAPIQHDTGWQTAEFVSGANPCEIYGSTGGPESWSAWTAELGDPTISNLIIVQDEGPASAYLANVSVNGVIAN